LEFQYLLYPGAQTQGLAQLKNTVNSIQFRWENVEI
jgi:hypothetical protein